MSTHSVDVIKIDTILPHSNADKLELIKIGEYICCVGKGQFKVGDKAVYIEPDYCVPVSWPEFSFLDNGKGKSHYRITVRRFRGVVSQGLLVPCPVSFNIGDSVMEYYGIVRYEPPEENNNVGNVGTYANSALPPKLNVPVYDLENWRKYSNWFEDGEVVWISEKLHGSNFRAVFHDGKIHLGSRTRWIKEDNLNNPWTVAAKQQPWLAEWCKNNPGYIVFSEAFGQVQSLKYGASDGEVYCRVFDIYHDGRYLDYDELMQFQPKDGEEFVVGKHLVFVPQFYVGPYSKEVVEKYVSGKSQLADHIREGIVVKPVKERLNKKFDRVALKVVSPEYLEMK